MTAITTEDQPAFHRVQWRERIDTALSAYAQFDAGCPPNLAEAIRYALLGPGKRLRPQLVLLAAEASGGSIERALPAACAVEMIHAYSLVHDDLPAMDDDDLRRGRPTCHKKFGEATAILAGDALLARAFEVLAIDIQPPEVAARCCAVLGRAAGAAALVGGQAADLAAEFASSDAATIDTRKPIADSRLQQLESIHGRKTAALFMASLELGGIVAGATSDQLAALAGYGRNVGLAFQITDDLGKFVGSGQSVGQSVASGKSVKRTVREAGSPSAGRPQAER